ncbi:TonB C-terminal domain-containing protein [Roseateles albus]|uniref:TonB C-terminal domain-containing protein n=1 Tax=Roseateles albus TaxID=2987525 RepID=A0ABT5KCB3_9BURK|nr:TonB C-terminal domain-containing protein [Roseateles albus]MDC8771017.1 TonB C-terminal domain-containing protein [Roseateles albus]
MSGLAEDHLDDAPGRKWLIRLGVALAFLAVVGAGIWAVKGLKSNEAPKQKVAKISILPDSPPPPPPPPKPELKKPEPPKDEPKQVMRDEQIKQAEAPKPANEPLKMEGAAGDGPSAFAAGSVGKDYSGGTPASGPAGGGATPADRAQERFYANSAKQLLRDELERRLKSDAAQLTATFAIWLERDGSIQRYELTPSGDNGNDTAMRLALDETSRQFKLPPPPALTQPMRFRLSVRPQA